MKLNWPLALPAGVASVGKARGHEPCFTAWPAAACCRLPSAAQQRWWVALQSLQGWPCTACMRCGRTFKLAPLLLHTDVQRQVARPGPQLARVLKLRQVRENRHTLCGQSRQQQ